MAVRDRQPGFDKGSVQVRPVCRADRDGASILVGIALIATDRLAAHHVIERGRGVLAATILCARSIVELLRGFGASIP